MKKIRNGSVFSIFVLVMSTVYPSLVAAENEADDPEVTLFGDHDFTSSEEETVVVELEESSVLEAAQEGLFQTRAQVDDERAKVQDDIDVLASDYEIGHEYGHVFSGFSVELPEDEIPNLLNIDGIEAVYPNMEYEVTAEDEMISIAEDEFDPLMLDSGPYIGSEEAHNLGYTGEGVTVAVIDTGVDYTHPDLQEAFGDYKGYDFVDNNDDPQETPPGDPRGGETNHGSHVAGTIAGNGLTVGIAPDAELLSYRVLGPGGSGTTADVIAGIEQAVLDGADVMNLSLGNPMNDPDFATSIALDQAMEDGVVAVTSNGNAGPDNWTVGSPGTSREAISVGASQLPYDDFSAELSSEEADYPSAEVMGYPSELDLMALNEGEFELLDAGIGAPENFEDEDFEGKIALMVRGELPFVEKVENAEDAGAEGAIIFNNVDDEEQPEVPGLPLPTVMLSLEDGQNLQSALAQGDNMVSFDLEFVQEIGETIADFSSRGPVMDTWMIKPDISAPGVNILSTVPTHDEDDPHGYASLQGTSMAAPHVAGATAVLLESNPELEVGEVRGLLMNTSESLVDPDTDEEYPFNTQGSGSIRIADALDSDSIVTPGSHSFGTFTDEDGVETARSSFTIKNQSEERQAYAFDIEFEGDPDGIDVMTSSDVALQPGESDDVRLNVQVDAGALDDGYYEGTITVESMTETIEVPTILFVSEPDYPRITSFSLEPGEGEDFEFSAHLPNGAEEFGMWVYDADSSEYIGLAYHTTNVPAGMYEDTWDGTVNGQPLPSGDYVIVGYAKQEDQTDQAESNVITIP
ncbi:minor extracellular serine protease Vpr [Geomicrobium halophilum]|uniref:Minor extracellular serine protease Vpr n=1 Tax=Geomicrobium halophilum TaxID=549000 RepID=A0A841PQ73_9BACL|nr:S8 family serine peptidase [Geomicrobium halophilum]MBB6450889.1 minor extracellular serine protease Vpr [Geomicrobium halophilum]